MDANISLKMRHTLLEYVSIIDKVNQQGIIM